MLAQTFSSLLVLGMVASVAAGSQRDLMIKRQQRASSGSGTATSSTATSSSSGAGSFTLTGPGPGEVFKAGDKCSVSWSPDTTGSSAWKSFTLDLNTGSNQQMTKLETIATGLDGTNPSVTQFTWTCPEVSPYSAIYFYQASQDGSTNPQWTTRWAIASASGQSTAPPHANQPEGGSPAIPWGNGKLVSAPVTPSTGGSSNSSISGSSSASTTAATSTSVPVPAIQTQPSTSTVPLPVGVSQTSNTTSTKSSAAEVLLAPIVSSVLGLITVAGAAMLF